MFAVGRPIKCLSNTLNMQASDAILGNLEFLGICRSSSMIDSYVCFMFQCNMSITNKKKVLHSEIKEIILLVRNFCNCLTFGRLKHSLSKRRWGMTIFPCLLLLGYLHYLSNSFRNEHSLELDFKIYSYVLISLT